MRKPKLTLPAFLPAMLALLSPQGRTQCPDFTGEFGVPGGLPYSDCVLKFDDGSGPSLFLGGQFTKYNGTGINNIARLEGSTPQALGAGVNGKVTGMRSYDDGTGPALVVTGFFTLAGGLPAAHIAKWDGSVWSTLRHGLSSPAWCLAQYDDGTGPALFAGGGFTQSGLPHDPSTGEVAARRLDASFQRCA